MAWEKIKQGLRAMTAPAIYLMSGFDGDITSVYVGGFKTTNEAIASLNTRHLDKTMDALKNSEEKTGVSQADAIEKINEIKKNREEELKDLIERLNNGSLKERKRILSEIIDKKQQEQKAVNKILQESANKIEKRQLKTLEEVREAKEDDDNQGAIVATALAEEQQKSLHQIGKIKEDLDKKNEVIQTELRKYSESRGTEWYSDIHWGSWQVWLALISFLAFAYLIYRTIMWVYYKFFNQ